jgi:hypothetical protein
MDKVINFICTMPAEKMTIGFERASPSVLLVYAEVDGACFYEPAGETPEDHAKALEKVTARIAEQKGAPATKIEVKVEGGKF